MKKRDGYENMRLFSTPEQKKIRDVTWVQHKILAYEVENRINNIPCAAISAFTKLKYNIAKYRNSNTRSVSGPIRNLDRKAHGFVAPDFLGTINPARSYLWITSVNFS